jgi:hypothetical protein
MKSVDNPKKVQSKPSPKAEKPGKPLTVTGDPSPFDDSDSAEPPCSPETAEQGYTVVEKPKLGKRR